MPTLRMTVTHPLDIAAAMEGLVRVNVAQMKRNSFPPLYSSGIRYKREFPREDWLPYDQALEIGSADCEDLSCILAAEYRIAGVHAKAVLYRTRSGGWHAVVRLPDGRIEDPSKQLGM